MKIISVIVPVYNVEKYIKHSLDSIINQTYKYLEIILIDDGSTDKSGIICDEYSKIDKRIKVIHKNNQGAAIAKNVGLDNMTGEYFIFVDSDDYLDLKMIETLVYHLENTGSDIVECGFVNHYVNKNVVRKVCENEEVLSNKDYLIMFTKQWSCSLLWNKLYKAHLTKNIRFKKEKRCIDDEFYTYKVVSNANKICRITDCLYFYRKRKSSVMNNSRNGYQISNDKVLFILERYNYIIEYFPELKNYFLDNLVNYYLILSKNQFLKKEDYQLIKRVLVKNLICITNIKYFFNILCLLLTSYKRRKIIKEENSIEIDDFYM